MFGSAELDALIADMFETMRDADGAGLAAPQIGVDLQLVIFGFEHSERYPEAPRGAADDPAQSGDHAAVAGHGGGLGRLPFGARPARRW